MVLREDALAHLVPRELVHHHGDLHLHALVVHGNGAHEFVPVWCLGEDLEEAKALDDRHETCLRVLRRRSRANAQQARSACKEGGEGREMKPYLIRIAICVNELGIVRVSSSVERRVQVLTAGPCVDLGSLLLPRDVIDDLAHNRLLAVHQAQQADDGRGDLRQASSTQ
eukprot:1595976-Pleurochrysis_carterae.AAC.1